MEFYILPFLAFLSVVVVAASYAAVSPEAYCKSVPPNTPMPKARHLKLEEGVVAGGWEEWMEDKGTSVGKPGKRTNVGVGKGGVSVSTGHKRKPHTRVSLFHRHPLPTIGQALVELRYEETCKKTITYHQHSQPILATPFWAPLPPSSQPTDVVTDSTGSSPGSAYSSALTAADIETIVTQRHLKLEEGVVAGGWEEWMEDKGTSVGKPGKRTNVGVGKGGVSVSTGHKGKPVNLKVTMGKLDSKEAKIMKKAVKECEEPGTKGEEKYGATSLESMVDFSTNKLGKNIQGVSTEKRAGDKTTVFYCHKKQTTKAYVVSLVAADSTKAKAMAVCHMDTSAWNSKHLACLWLF
ncbi:BURP domain-containing protein [Actinidia rufa]|uniref:BURP domain-containing protein n=1 Tax=Actinidia rufa TaxID=165716 RepID=A0A7J0DHH1_9ERIC|nr:BURP domain-containing protein [Actinidia rufa]